MTTTTAPLAILPWVTVWETETIRASIAHDKVHVVTRRVTSNNAAAGVANPNATRTETFQAACGTTRRGRYLAVAQSETVTCARCAKHA